MGPKNVDRLKRLIGKNYMNSMVSIGQGLTSWDWNNPSSIDAPDSGDEYFSPDSGDEYFSFAEDSGEDQNLNEQGLSSIGPTSNIQSVIPAISDPSKVEKIYVPKDGICSLERYQTKMDELMNKPGFLGVAYASKKDGSGEVPLGIIKREESQDEVYFEAFSGETGISVGYAKVLPFLKSNNYLRNYDPFRFPYRNPEETIGHEYGPNKNRHDRVFIDYMENSSEESLQHIGYVLIKTVFQYYKSACDGRISLLALNNVFTFYYKLGFRIADSNLTNLNALIADAVKSMKRKANTEKFLAHMYLPDEARALWTLEIQKRGSKGGQA
jgi:hypothetical protein